MEVVLQNGFEVLQDATMGRVLVAKRSFQPGEILWNELSFVVSHEESFDALQKELLINAFPVKIQKQFGKIVDVLTSLDHCQSADTARNFLVLLAVAILRKRDLELTCFLILKHNNATSNFTEALILSQLSLLEQLNGANLNECVEDIKVIKSEFPDLIPKGFGVNDAARLLAILNTNQLEIGEDCSGLFPFTAIVEHSCCPNCSFTTFENQLFMTAIQPIQINERISIDYGNHFYHATGERLRNLESTYGFQCQCALCQGPDRKRGFKCQTCNVGVCFPVGVSMDNFVSDCGHVPSTEYIQYVLGREEYFNQNELLDETQLIDALKQETCFHETHYIRFWALDNYSSHMLELAQEEIFVGNKERAQHFYMQAKDSLLEVIRLLEIQLPPIHHEKVIYYDKLAQLFVTLNDIVSAKQAFGRAYQHSCQASGSNTPPTLAIRDLFENTPQSTNELYNRYQQQQQQH